jgi:hypothetical protein
MFFPLNYINVLLTQHRVSSCSVIYAEKHLWTCRIRRVQLELAFTSVWYFPSGIALQIMMYSVRPQRLRTLSTKSVSSIEVCRKQSSWALRPANDQENVMIPTAFLLGPAHSSPIVLFEDYEVTVALGATVCISMYSTHFATSINFDRFLLGGGRKPMR